MTLGKDRSEAGHKAFLALASLSVLLNRALLTGRAFTFRVTADGFHLRLRPPKPQGGPPEPTDAPGIV